MNDLDRPEWPPEPLPDKVVLPTEQGPTVFSPSPTQGEKTPQRRAVDTQSFRAEWAAVGMGLLVWAVSFFAEISDLTWADLKTLKFIAGHASQVLGVIVAVLGAKQIKN